MCVGDGGGEVQCWGYNRYGQSDVPEDLGEAVKVSAGWGHSCALLSDKHNPLPGSQPLW